MVYHMIKIVVPPNLHVERVKGIVILTVIAKMVLSVEKIIAHLELISLPRLTVAYQVFIK